jgi:signal transduction histidine kinase/AmiR/NasT family two-component response regulator
MQGYTGRMFRNLTLERVQTAKDGLLDYLVELEQLAMHRAELIASRVNIIQHIENAEYAAAQHMIMDYLIGIDIISLTDENGIVIFRSYNDIYGDDVSMHHVIANVIRTGEKSSAIAMLPNGTLTVCASVPVYAGGAMIGIVNCNFDLMKSEYLYAFKERTGYEATIVINGIRTATTISEYGRSIAGSRADAAIVESVMGRGETFSGILPLYGSIYGVHYSPLVADGRVIGMLFTGVNIDEILAGQRVMNIWILLVSGIGIVLVVVFVIMIVALSKKNEHAHQQLLIRKVADERTMLMLDSSPLICKLWSRDGNIIECNNMALKLFDVESKEIYKERLFEFAPVTQPNGRLTTDFVREKLDTVFAEGRCVFEYMAQKLDGTPMPQEVTLIRLDYGDEYIAVGYERDLRNRNRLVAEINYHTKLLQAVNQMAVMLHNADMNTFDETLYLGISKLTEAINVGSVNLWKNQTIDGEIYCSKEFEFSTAGNAMAQGTRIKYDDHIPEWRDFLLLRKNINSMTRDMSRVTRDNLAKNGILSTLIVPIYIHENFWGTVCFDDVANERVFTNDEEVLLSSASLLIANSFIRNEMVRQLENAVMESKIAHDKSNNTLSALENILNSMDAGIYATVPETGEILFLNSYMKKAFNIEGDSAIGKYCYKTFRSDQDAMCDFCPCLKMDVDSDDIITWEEYLPEWDASVLHSDCYINWHDGKRVHLQHAVDITALVKSTKEAQSASKAKGDFLSTMSHELRTPMNAIIGMAKIGLRSGTQDGQLNSLQKIDEVSAHLLGIINDILDMAKIESGKLELSLSEYDFNHMINRVMSVIKYRADEKQQTLLINIDSRIPQFVIGDDTLLIQVLTNLLANAVKFTRETGTVQLDIAEDSLTGDQFMLKIDVTDSGIGITPAMQERIFEPFEQIDNKSNRVFGGTGLGLSITKRIVEMMGGRIWVESEPGKGSRFSFTVELKRGSKTRSNHAAIKQIQGAENGNPFAGKRVLFAEDIEINREILLSLLESSGLMIDCAETGEEALSMYNSDPERYDVIFMDLQMPKMDGLEAARQIRALPQRQRGAIPIIAMTANVFKEDIVECLAAGMNDHIGKPLDLEKINEILIKHLVHYDTEKQTDKEM